MSEGSVSFETIDGFIKTTEKLLSEAECHEVKIYYRGVLFALHAVKGEYDNDY